MEAESSQSGSAKEDYCDLISAGAALGLSLTGICADFGDWVWLEDASPVSDRRGGLSTRSAW